MPDRYYALTEICATHETVQLDLLTATPSCLYVTALRYPGGMSWPARQAQTRADCVRATQATMRVIKGCSL